VAVDDFDIGRTLLGPREADAPLIIDADRVLTASVSRERFETVRRRRAQVTEVTRMVEHVKLSQCLFLDPAESFHESAHPQALGGTIAKRPDHVIGIYGRAL
jgi:hypothetical protein